MGLSSGGGLVSTATSSGGGSVSSSGLTEAQVDARITANTPWKFISKVDITSSTGYAELPLEGNHTTYKLLGDQIGGTTANYPYIRLTQASGGITSGYGLGKWYGWTSYNYSYNGNASEIHLHQYNGDWDKNFEFVFTTTENSTRPIFRWSYGNATSTYDPYISFGGGQLNISTSTTITGVQVHMNTGNISRGSFKLYGLNKHA